MLTDTHCHISDDQLYERIDEVLENAKQANVTRMLVVCVGLKEYERAYDLQQKGYPIDIALGFHPCDLYKVSEEDFNRLEQLLKEDKLIAVGEIGLDYYWDDVLPQDQKVGLIRQLQLAEQYNKPVIIHMREATKDCVDLLLQHSCVGIMHCYSGSFETAQILMNHGYYISYGGPLTFKNSKGAPECAKKIPLDRLFVETDCPYLTPHPHRGKQNEPMYLPFTFKKLCEIKEVDEETMAKQLEKNYQCLFHSKM